MLNVLLSSADRVVRDVAICQAWKPARFRPKGGQVSGLIAFLLHLSGMGILLGTCVCITDA